MPPGREFLANMSYEPRPVEVTEESFPKELEPLRELLAANAHEVWSKARMEQGWTWGPVRDDALKQHPCLVPYDELPEEEKVHDRNAVAGALAAIRSHGWKLLPPAGGGGIDAASVAVADAAALRKMWDERAKDDKRAHAVENYRMVAKRALKLGEQLLAFDAAAAGLRHYPEDLALHHLVARSHANMGRHRTALKRVEELIRKGHGDADTLGLLGRTYKDEGFAFMAAGGCPLESWRKSAEAYGRAFERHVDYFTGINAATMTFFSGDLVVAAELAARVDGLAVEALAASPGDSWAQATRGEAALLLRRWDQAGAHYRQAAVGMGKTSEELASMARQARRIMQRWGEMGEAGREVESWFHEVFPRPDVVVFSGHRFDDPGRANPRFPLASAERVAGALRACLERLGTQVVYLSLSTGADLLMAEAALAAGVSLNLVLPKPVADLATSEMAERLARVVDRAHGLTVLGDGTVPDDPQVFHHCNHVFSGLAMLFADAAGLAVRGIAVWNGQAGDGGGGTADAVADWRRDGISVEVIDPLDGGIRQLGPDVDGAGAVVEDEGMVVRAMLFADVKGYSKLEEKDLQAFTLAFRKDLAALVRDGKADCEVVDTWGDGVFMVFRDVLDAARAALFFRDAVAQRDWAGLGISIPMGVRVGLHAGPVMVWADDPLSGRAQFCGRNIARAARIEPITEVNEVYASDGFAALLKRRRPAEVSLEYVGSVPLAKEYGSQRIFRLSWTETEMG